jgi:hypothetical protein
MDLNYSPEELAFRDEVRGWLAATCPTDIRDKVTGYRGLSKDDLLRWHKILAAKGWSCRLAGGMGRHRLGHHAALHLRRGVRPGRRADAAALRPQHVRLGAAALRQRRAEEALPAAHRERRRLLGPGLFRARLRLRPGVA